MNRKLLLACAGVVLMAGPAKRSCALVSEGFPVIDSSNVVLRRNPRMMSPAIDGMAKVIRDAFQPMG